MSSLPQMGMAAFAAMALAYLVSPANATPLYGYISNGMVLSAGLPPVEFPSQSWNYSNAGSPIQVTSYTSPVLSALGLWGYAAPSSVTGTATAWATANYGVMHGYAATTSTGSCPPCVTGITDQATFGVNWVDTIFIAGLPGGTPVDLELTVALDSAASAPVGGSAQAHAAASIGSQQVSVINTGGQNGLLTASVMIHTSSGATLSFGSMLNGSADVSSIFSTAESAILDASNTAYSSITVLTPGASFTTASGATYSAATPEPGSFWLVAVVGLMAVLARKGSF